MRNALVSFQVAGGLLLAMGYAFCSAQAQSDAELKALDTNVVELFRAGKFSEAIPLAQRYADAMKARHGPDHADYADALGNLALALNNASRFSEAEPLYRVLSRSMSGI